MGDMTNRSARADFTAQVSRLVRAARGRLLIKRSLAGLFFGLLPAVASAFLAGTVALPVPAPALAAALAAAGAAAGALTALLSRTHLLRLLILADSALGSRELASTALEISAAPQGEAGLFAGPIMEDASRLLAGTDPRTILGKLRMPLLPFIPVAALLTIGALLFPMDLRSLFTRQITDSQMARIGEELQESGERLAESAQGQGLGRSIDLSRQLAQLGSDIEARKVAPREALDRMAQIESGLQQEYGLRMQEVLPVPGAPQSGQGKPGEGPSAGQGQDSAARGLADALDQLRKAQRELGGQDSGEGGPGNGKGQHGGTQNDQPQGGQGQDQSQGGQGQGRQGEQGQGQQGQAGKGKGPGGAGTDSESGNGPGESGESGIGKLPAPEKRGPATPINPGDKGPGLQAQGNAANDESTRMLVRTLPEWKGSRLPEEAILNQYSRQAESALARDEVPLKLRQSVKEYFTTIGITK
jgi:hypothetical protein